MKNILTLLVLISALFVGCTSSDEPSASSTVDGGVEYIFI